MRLRGTAGSLAARPNGSSLLSPPPLRAQAPTSPRASGGAAPTVSTSFHRTPPDHTVSTERATVVPVGELGSPPPLAGLGESQGRRGGGLRLSPAVSPRCLLPQKHWHELFLSGARRLLRGRPGEPQLNARKPHMEHVTGRARLLLADASRHRPELGPAPGLHPHSSLGKTQVIVTSTEHPLCRPGARVTCEVSESCPLHRGGH